jgi:GNAT superfamily N-acetyltransferase
MAFRAFELSDPALPDDVRQRVCLQYYDRIYKAAFPIADEAEDPNIWLRLMRERPPAPQPMLRILLATPEGRLPQDESSAILAGIHFEFYRNSGAALVTYLCVRPDMRRHGIAAFLLGRAVETMRSDAGSASAPLFAEAENPDSFSEPSIRGAASRRLAVLSRLGFREIPIRYRQPALAPGKRPVDHLKFLVWSAEGPAGVKLSTLRAFMREFYSALNAGEPDETRMFGGLREGNVQPIVLVRGE